MSNPYKAHKALLSGTTLYFAAWQTLKLPVFNIILPVIGKCIMDYYMIGQKIRKFRKGCGLSQKQLAEKAGISTTHLIHIETGNTKLSLPVFVDIAVALSVQTNELLYDTPSINLSTKEPERK